jgi:methionyl-tRNA synthetase
MKEWLGEPGENKLADWDISHDAPYFGFPIPGTNNQKFFYVWLDAPVGYFGSFGNYVAKQKAAGKTIDKDAFLRPGGNTEMVHFIGKDILYFHALFWPAMLEFAGYRTPTKVFAHGFLTVDGQKMSKSRGTFITAESYLQQGLNPEWLRYYYAAKLNSTMEDIDLNLGDFVARVNSDLVGKYINIVSRCAAILSKQFNGELAQEIFEVNSTNRPYTTIAYGSEEDIKSAYEDREYGKAIREIMRVCDMINRRIDQDKPWELAKDPSKREYLHDVISDCINAFKVVTYYLSPVLPKTAESAAKFLGLSLPLRWENLSSVLKKIGPYQHLMTRIDPKQITALVEVNKESLQPVSPTPSQPAQKQERRMESPTPPPSQAPLRKERGLSPSTTSTRSNCASPASSAPSTWKAPTSCSNYSSISATRPGRCSPASSRLTTRRSSSDGLR